MAVFQRRPHHVDRTATKTLRDAIRRLVNVLRTSQQTLIDTRTSGFSTSIRTLETRIVFDAALADTVDEPGADGSATPAFETLPLADFGAHLSGISEPVRSFQTEFAFIDASVPDLGTLIAGLGQNVEIVLLEEGRDGVEQIAEVLSSRTNVSAIHIISHGSEGALALGTAKLTAASMEGVYADELSIIRDALSDNADILIYGCDFGRGEIGENAVTLLSDLTGADVAASDDATGAVDLGGDWDLEVTHGAIDAKMTVSFKVQQDWTHTLANTVGGETIVNTTTSGTQQTSTESGRQIASDSSGNYVVVWDDGAEVYARKFNADGTAATVQFQVNTTTLGTQDAPSVAMDASGSFVVAWTGQDASGRGVYIQRYNAAGVAQGSETLVNAYTSLNQDQPAIAMNTSGFVVAWASNGQDGSVDGIYARRYDSSGNALGSEFRVNTHTSSDQKEPQIAMNAAGSFVVTWSGDGQDGSGYGIYAQRYDANGVAAGSEFRVNTTTSNTQKYSSVAVDSNGNFVVTWTSEYQDGSWEGIYGQRYNSSGVAQGGEFQVATHTSMNQSSSNVSMSSDGRFLVTWSSFDQDGSGWGTYAQEFASSGVKEGSEFRVSSTTSNFQEKSDVTWNNEKATIVWSGNGTGDTQGVFTQRYITNYAPSDNTATSTTNGGLAINTSGNDAYLVADDGSALLGGRTQFTIETRFSVTNQAASENVIYSYAVDGTSDNEVFLRILPSGRLSFSVNSSNAQTTAAYTQLLDGSTNTVSVSWNSTGGTVVFYINGSQVETVTGIKSGYTTSTGGTLVLAQDQDVELGSFNTTQMFSGILYDARIFSTALSAGTIASNFASDVPYNTSSLIANWRFNSLSTDEVIVDTVSGNNLKAGHASGTGFTTNTPSLTLAIVENSTAGTVVGAVTATDQDRTDRIAALLAADSTLRYSAETNQFYRFVSTSTTWTSAEAAARSGSGTSLLNGQTGQLVVIRSAAENEVIWNLADAYGQDVWISASDASTEGAWRWIENGVASDQFWSGTGSGSNVGGNYENWRVGQPNAATSDGDYGRMDFGTGEWTDENSGATGRYIIEWDADAVLDATHALTYSIKSQTVSGAFNINSDSGVITVADGTKLDFETAASHTVTVVVTDASGATYEKAFTVALSNVNEAPVITSNSGGATASISLAENQTAVTTVTVSDPDAGATKTFSITGGADAALFQIDSSTGALSFKSAPNFEVAGDSGANNIYDVTVQVTDGSLTDTQAIAVTVTNANEAPTEIQARPSISATNLLGDYQFGAATNLGRDDGGDGRTLTLVGSPGTVTGPTGSAALDLATGQYAQLASVSSGGAMSFGAMVRFDTTASWQRVFDLGQASSAGIGNIYVGREVTTNNLTFTVETNNGSLVSYRATASNAITNGTWLSFVATVDASGNMNLYLNGALAASATGIAPASGVRDFLYLGRSHFTGDAGFDGAIDNFFFANGALSAAEVSALYNQTGFTVAENSANTTVIGTIVGSDPDASTTYSYSLTDDAGGRFAINSTTGEISVANSSLLNFEASASHSITAVVTDQGGLSTTKSVTVTLTNVNDAPLITSDGGGATASVNVAENQTAVTTVTATDVDAGATRTFSVSGTDASFFDINSSTGVLTFKSAPSYETKSDSGANGIYDVIVTVTDNGALTDTQALAITVTDVNEAPIITSDGGGATASINVAENQTAITTVTSTDVDAGATRTFSIAGGADANLFFIDSSTGVLTFKSAPDFETKADAGANGVYDVTVMVSDGVLTDSQDIALTVTNVNEAPVTAAIEGTALAYTENQGAVAITSALSVSDVDSATLSSATITVSAGYVSGEDVLAFTSENGISGSWNAATGTLSLSGTATVAQYQAALRAVTYQNTSDTPSTSSRTVTFTVNDGAATSNIASRTITLAAVNDAPVNTLPASYSTNEDTSVALTGLSVSDADLGTGTMTVTLSVATGTITASTGGGVTVSGSGTGTITLTGSISDLNSYLGSGSRPLYVPVADHNGNVTLTMTTSDGTAPVQSTATIVIAAVADTGDVSTSVTEDTPLAFSVLTGFENPDATVTHINGTPISVGNSVAVTGGIVLFDVDELLYFTPTADYTGTSPFTVTILSGGVTETITITPTFTAVNDAPVAASIEGTPLAYIENQGAATLTSTLTLSDVDSATLSNAVIEISGNYAAGQDVLAFTNQNGITGSWDSGLGRLTLSGVASVADYQAALHTVTYQNTSDSPSTATRTVSFTVNDGTLSSSTQQRQVTVTSVNDAPNLGTSTMLPSISEDATTNTGFLVSLLAGPATDADSGALEGIAIQGVNTTNGIWQFTLNNGGTWSDIGPVSVTNALLLPSDTNARVRFVPNADWNGFVGGFSYRAWDQTSGSGGSYADVSTNGGTTAFSSGLSGTGLSVTAVNDAPVATSVEGTALVYTENQGAAAITSTLALSDVDSANLSSAIVQITNGYASSQDVLSFTDQNGITGSWDAATGRLTLSGVASVANYQLALRSITYQNDSESPSTAMRTVSFTVSDGALSSAVRTRDIAVAAVNDAPVITSNGGGATAAINAAENQTAVTTVTSTDVDVGATKTFTISGGADAALFDIDSATGVLTFKAAPSFESKIDAGADGVYDVTVQVSDGSLTDTQDLAITVTDVNEAPVITSNGGGATAAINAAENQTAVTTVTSTDVDAGATKTFTISGGADSAFFDIDSATGVLTFKAAPSFESKIDAGADGVYDVTVQVSDGSLTDTQDLAITVTDVNEAPVITSNGGGATAAINAAENQTAVTTVTSTDVDVGATKTFTISGGADAALFDIDSATGVLTFKAAPSFESKIDAGADGVYDVTVQVSDGVLTDTQDLAITVTDVNEAPVITSDGGGATASINAAENQTAVTTVTSTDVDAGATKTFTISGGADSAFFEIDSATGVLTFKSTPNFENKVDAGADGTYDVTVQVSDGVLTDTQDLAITVTDVNEAPVITSNGGGATAAINAAENQTAVTTVTSSDVDAGATKTFTISGGADAALFDIDSATGVLTFKAAPSFESKVDAGADGVYDVTVQVSDGSLTDTQDLAITVADVNEAPVITSNGGGATAAINAAENQTAVTTVTSTDVDAGATKTFTISGGADSAFFDIDSATGVLTFKSAPNFENKVDAGADGTYDVTVQVSDGSLTDTQDLAITVTDVNEAPVITSNGGGATAAINAAENQTAVTTVTSSDVDAGATKTFTISGGADAALFDIDSATGVLTFKAAPSSESKVDAGSDGVYDVTVQVSDGLLTDTQDLAITVTDVNEAPTITSSASATVFENQTTVMTVTATDPETPGSLTYTIVGGADSGRFAIDSITGALTFITGPDYEIPTDVGTDNIYDVRVEVSDGVLTETQDIAVTVANQNEAPAIQLPGGRTIAEDSVATFSAALGQAITISDPDAGASQVELTITATNGAVTLASLAGLTFSVGDGTDDATMTVRGTVADINTALDGLTYTPAANTHGTGAIDFTLDDLGNSGAGGPIAVTAQQVITITAVNDAAIGNATISGIATEDQTLTLDTSAITDADGLGSFSIAWLRDGVSISGATGLSYTLGDADVGKAISANVSYVDGDGTTETLTSTATAAVANINDAPTGVPAIVGTAAEDQTLTADLSSVADDDGLGAFSYQWLRGGVAISSATGSVYTLVDDDVGQELTLAVTFVDAHGTSESLTSLATTSVANVNDLPTGSPTISGSATEGEMLTVSTVAITDADGLGTVSYQWLRGGAIITGATSSTYTLSAADIGAAIAVEVSYVDGQGSTEVLMSASTSAVSAIPVTTVVVSTTSSGDGNDASDEAVGSSEPSPPLAETDAAADDSMTLAQTREEAAATDVAPAAAAAPVGDVPVAIMALRDVDGLGDSNDYVLNLALDGFFVPSAFDERGLSDGRASTQSDRDMALRLALLKSNGDDERLSGGDDLQKDIAFDISRGAIGISSSALALTAAWALRAATTAGSMFAALPLWSRIDVLPLAMRRRALGDDTLTSADRMFESKEARTRL